MTQGARTMIAHDVSMGQSVLLSILRTAQAYHWSQKERASALCMTTLDPSFTQEVRRVTELRADRQGMYARNHYHRVDKAESSSLHSKHTKLIEMEDN